MFSWAFRFMLISSIALSNFFSSSSNMEFILSWSSVIIKTLDRTSSFLTASFKSFSSLIRCCFISLILFRISSNRLILSSSTGMSPGSGNRAFKSRADLWCFKMPWRSGRHEAKDVLILASDADVLLIFSLFSCNSFSRLDINVDSALFPYFFWWLISASFSSSIIFCILLIMALMLPFFWSKDIIFFSMFSKKFSLSDKTAQISISSSGRGEILGRRESPVEDALDVVGRLRAERKDSKSSFFSSIFNPMSLKSLSFLSV